MKQFLELINKIQIILDQKPTVLIGIDGIGGSGKSTVAQRIQQEIASTEIIALDDFRSKEVYEVDQKKLITQLLNPLKKGQATSYTKWLWGEERYSDLIEVKPEGVFIFEGVTALHPNLSEYYDLKIWVDCSAEKAFQRGLSRDRNEYKIDTEKSWLEQWIPYEQEYIKKYKPQEVADIVYKVI